ncbi:32611_t:CDS:2, partial [Gigaspora margarita]
MYFQGGEGVVTYSNGIPAIRCSAGFSAIHNETLRGYLITSARCLPSNTTEIYHAVWNSHQEQFDYFGVLRDVSLNNVDYAMCYHHFFIDLFNFIGIQVPVGHEVCISSYDSHVKCGDVIGSSSEVRLRSLRPGVRYDVFYNMIQISIDGQLSNRDIGGTAFSMEYDEINDVVHLLVLGIVTEV